jgi:hypothetical protein
MLDQLFDLQNRVCVSNMSIIYMLLCHTLLIYNAPHFDSGTSAGGSKQISKEEGTNTMSKFVCKYENSEFKIGGQA